jgi:hypothetical protein
MAQRANSQFEIKSWDEKTYKEMDGGRKLTHASVTQTFSGDIEGESSWESLMCYRDDGTASFVGFQLVEGQIADRSGSFVLETVGNFDGQVARSTSFVVAGSGTGELQGLRGEGTNAAGHEQYHDFTLDYHFE